MVAYAAAGVLVGFAAAAGWLGRWFVDRPGPVRGSPVEVSWPGGLDARESAQLLTDLELTDNATAMELFLRATSAPDCIRSGPHLLSDAATPRQLVALLCRSDARDDVKVTIPEGFHRFAIAGRLEKLGIVSRAAFLLASEDRELLYALDVEPAEEPEGDTAEGFLFPATYTWKVNSDPRELVAALVKAGNQRWRSLVERHPEGWKALQGIGLDRRAVITLASMVEKEAAVPEERAIIASVFLNRLQDPEFRRLQSDPTAIYGCYAMPADIPACRDFGGRATPAILRDPNNRFSTYVVDHLPPGPIANPGAASIEAVLAPADSEYRFFVAKGKGRHEFSVSYEDHLAAVQRLREQKSQR